MRVSAVVLLLGIAVAGCNGGDDEDSTLTPKDERAVRSFFATLGASKRDTTCVIDELVDRIGAGQVATIPGLSENPGRADREQRKKTGRQFAMAMLACNANPEHTACFSIWDTKAEAKKAATRASALGFDRADIRRGSDRHGPVPAVTFSSGKTGAAADEIREDFEPFVHRAGGRMGHPGDGCLEQPFFD